MTQLTIGTAKITFERGQFVLRYMNGGSCLIGERTFRTRAEAADFCDERHLRVI